MNDSVYHCESHRQTGVTLIELMVALVLGLVVMGAAVQVLISNKQSYRIEQALARVQENGRYIVLAMSRDIRMAGFLGCSSRSLPNPKIRLNNPPTFNNPPAGEWASTSIQGFYQGGGWTAPTPFQDDTGATLTLCDVANGGNATCQVSDVVRIVRGGEFFASTAADMANAAATFDIRTADYDRFTGDDDVWFITDCRSIDIMRENGTAAVGTDTRVTPQLTLSKSYPADTIVTPVIESTYFVADDGDGVPSLYRLPITDPADGAPAQAIEMARGVEGMVVTYGVNTTGDEFADVYTGAAGVAGLGGWGKVVAVRVNLLLKSTDPNPQTRILDNPVSVRFPPDPHPDAVDVNSGANADHRLRLQYTFTVGIRNRLP